MYGLRFGDPYFNIEETGVSLAEAELRADVLHCLYRNRPKERNDTTSQKLISGQSMSLLD